MITFCAHNFSSLNTLSRNKRSSRGNSDISLGFMFIFARSRRSCSGSSNSSYSCSNTSNRNSSMKLSILSSCFFFLLFFPVLKPSTNSLSTTSSGGSSSGSNSVLVTEWDVRTATLQREGEITGGTLIEMDHKKLRYESIYGE